jgi:hypothetical protein
MPERRHQDEQVCRVRWSRRQAVVALPERVGLLTPT